MSVDVTAAAPPRRDPARARGLRRMRENWLAWVVPAITLVVLLLIWQGLNAFKIVDPLILPSFTDVMSSLVRLVQKSYFWDATKTTAIETLAGFAIGVVVAWIAGTLIGMFRIARYALYPPAVALQITPRVALAPLFFTWFGLGITTRIVMAAALCFFPVLINVVVGLETADQDARTFMRSLGASRWETYKKLYLPSSLPLIFAGLKNAITLALIGAIVAEFIGGADGMGVLVKNLNFALAVSDGFAVIVALMIFGLILYGLMEILDRKLIFWRTH